MEVFGGYCGCVVVDDEFVICELASDELLVFVDVFVMRSGVW